MNSFNRRTALRISMVSILLAAVASPIAWFVAHRNAEQDTVLHAMDESRSHLRYFSASLPTDPQRTVRAQKAAETLIGGLFDVAEIYGPDGVLDGAATTELGQLVEGQLPPHQRPAYSAPSFESLKLKDKRWVLRVFVPLQAGNGSNPGQITGYFEGVRVVPDWERKQMLNAAMIAALMAGLASLLCGAAIYPVVVHLSADNQRKAQEVLESHISMMKALGRAIAKRDSDTGAHNFRVAWIASRIAERLGLRDRQMQSLIAGSFLHDVGKIGTPDAILLKPGELSADEVEVMRKHVTQGEDIVSGIGWLEEAKAVVAAHHEKWNGSGYPRKLAGDAIPLAARIFAVADVFDALCSRRPYKEAMEFGAVMELLERDAGLHFDPAVIAAFRPIAREVFDRLAKCSEDDAQRLLEERLQVHFGI